MLVAVANLRQPSRGTRGQARSPSLGRRPAAVRSESPWGDSARELARTFRASSSERWKDRSVYVTIDLDCLRAEEAVTNWESGRFTVEDVAWALTQLRASSARIVGGDICGAFSPPVYARRKQRFAAEMDHPKLPVPDLEAATKINLRAFEALWPILAD